MDYKRGDQVEVISKEDGFEGSYYEAIIVTKLQKKEYIVTYRTLLKDDHSGPLREVVTFDELRPAPPEILASWFELNDEVDAFDNDGWWVGKIIGRIGSLYNVYFESSGEEIAYRIDRLRVHQDCVNGRWISS
ncbi:hypothetical protein ACH5RR_012993 [Cinchona calisaya]|uniref:Agenet domain-containing protein n=1 Tax=Cinchona calisaya TaxID=153742 RepID=A0ABD3A0Z3_9GENT